MIYFLLFCLATTEPINPTTNSVEIHQSQISSSLSPSSSYTASSSHITEIEDHDCDLDSGYNDEVDPSSNSSIPTSPWLDTPISDEMFVWVLLLFLFLFNFRQIKFFFYQGLSIVCSNCS